MHRRESFEPLVICSKADKATLEDFDIKNLIGRGRFGKVYLAKHKGTGKSYAMKILKKKDVEMHNQRAHTKTEREILGTINSPFVVTLHYAFQTEDKLCMVMEYLQGGELFFLLKSSGFFTEERTIFYAAEIVLGLEALHKAGIIYRDLKPENVLLCEDGHLKLTDFGLSKLAVENNSEPKKSYSFCGTPEYLAPEIIKGTGHDKAVDWWSLGILVYEMLSGNPPFLGENKKELLKTIVQKPVVLDPKMSENATSLLKCLLCQDPKARLGSSKKDAEEIKEHPFFSTVNWKLMIEKQVTPPMKPEPLGDEQDAEKYADSDIASEAWKKDIIYDGFSYQKDKLNDSDNDLFEEEEFKENKP